MPNVTQRQRSHRTRAKIKDICTRPRLSVFRSNKHISVQLIDDARGTTIAYASTLESQGKGTKTDQAKTVGKLIAERAKEAGADRVVFDRGSYKYHGRVKAVAEGAREGGLSF